MANFDQIFDEAAWTAAERYGLATPNTTRSLVAAQRLALVRGRQEMARTAVVDLQQWQLDDDVRVRHGAHDALKSLITDLHTGALSDRDTEHQAGRAIDRLVQRVLFKNTDPDKPAHRLHDSAVQRRIRVRLIGAALLTSLVTATLIILRIEWVPLATLFVGATFDILDGSFARVTHMRVARLRWRSCIFSHLGDLAIICAIGVSAAMSDRDDTYAFIVIAAALVSLLGSFVRTSALQAGYRFWRSSYERWVRYAAIIVYIVSAAFGHDETGAVITTSLLIVFGLAETARVVISVDRMPAVVSGAMYFLNVDHEIRAYPMSDADEDTLWYDDPPTDATDDEPEPVTTGHTPDSRTP